MPGSHCTHSTHPRETNYDCAAMGNTLVSAAGVKLTLGVFDMDLGISEQGEKAKEARQCTNPCTNAQMRQCANAPMPKCANAPMYRCTNAGGDSLRLR